MTDAAQETIPWWVKDGYLAGRELSGDLWVVVMPMIGTFRLALCDPPPGFIFDFYCYENLLDALRAYTVWNGSDDAPGPWVRHFGSSRRRLHGDPSTEHVWD